jgi:hypothetical protein
MFTQNVIKEKFNEIRTPMIYRGTIYVIWIPFSGQREVLAHVLDTIVWLQNQ